ncbi:MAG TPA: hypothetical protein VMF87_00465 [Streptosporangiaceae bacterium]|nr:hypothetical protein [Streptosporangiaceae bacterium]
MRLALRAIARTAGSVVTLTVALAGCSAGRPAARGTSPGPAGGTPSPAAPASADAVPASGEPGCSTATAAAPGLRGVPTPMTPVPATPFGVTVAGDGRWAFVALTGSGTVGVFRVTSRGTPVLARQVTTGGRPLGDALTSDGRYLLVADDAGGAAVISVGRAESGAPGALLGTLGGRSGGAIEVAVSPGGRFAFVSLEDEGSIAVYNLRRALTGGFRASDLVGTIPMGVAPVGMAISPDGRWLYATSEVASGLPVVARGRQGGRGTLSVISVPRAETDPAGSVVSTVVAGCSPVRAITSADGAVVWVTARGSDRLLGFSATRLRTEPENSLLASVAVGAAPVGLALVNDGKQIVVADSNRFGAPGAASSLAVVGVAAALAGRPALLGYLRAGGFPREVVLEPSGRTLLVGNFTSQQLEAVDLAGLP